MLRYRILILDDDTDYLETIQGLLTEAGYLVSTCSKATESLKAISLYKPDCLLMDLNMPCFKGDEILPLIRRGSPNLPVVVCTGEDQVDERFLLQYGVGQVLLKPFTPQLLYRAIQRAIGARTSISAERAAV